MTNNRSTLTQRATRILLLLILCSAWSAVRPTQAHPLALRSTDTTGWFPFTQRGSDSSDTLIHAGELLLDNPGDNPATLIDQRGFVTTDANGHFVFKNTGKRIRFWGIGIGAGAAFPASPDFPPRTGETGSIQDAERVAARLAKLGFNAVRLHHLDNPNWAGTDWGTLWQDAGDNTQEINPVQLGRLDYLIYQLKRHGIYVDLNLRVSRTERPNDGLTDAAALDNYVEGFHKNITYFDPVSIALQKRYAEQLLTHLNPYTKLAYKDDPVILTTEITNEDNLFLALIGDQLHFRPNDPTSPNSLPQFYSQELDGWSTLGGGPTINRLANAGFEQGEQEWFTLVSPPAQASFSFANNGANGSQTLQVQVGQPSSESWQIQFGQAHLAMQQGQQYEVQVTARASSPATLHTWMIRSREPWDNLGLSQSSQLTTQWQTFTYPFQASESNLGQVQLVLAMGDAPAGTTIWFDQILFREKNAFPGWHGWLAKKYGSTAAIATAWRDSSSSLPPTELLINGGFENDLTNWSNQTFNGSQATFTVDGNAPNQGAKSARIDVSQTGSENWHVQLTQNNFSLVAGQGYRLRFAAKASVTGELGMSAQQGHEPWAGLGLGGSVNLSNQWQNFQVDFRATGSDSNALLVFHLGQSVRTLWLDNVSLKANPIPGLLANESLEANTIARLPRNQWNNYAAQRGRDTLQFYMDTEASYDTEMHNYIQKTLGSRSLNIGSTNLYNTLAQLPQDALLDFIDNHLYWEHPSWPSGPVWSPTGWVINNQAWVNNLWKQPGDGNANLLFGKATVAVKGKPFTMTEFNAVTPNRYEAEGPLLMATFANLQDWDGIFMFQYAGDQATLNIEHAASWFDLVGNPIDSALMPVVARLFIGQQSAAAPNESLLRFTRSEVYESIHSGWAGDSAQYLMETKGVSPLAVLGSRLRIADFAAASPQTLNLPTPAGPIYTSNGGQIQWDTSLANRARYTLNAPQMQAALGFLNGTTVALTDLQLQVTGKPSAAPNNADFAAITLQSLTAQPIASSNQLLLGVFTRFENTGMVWNDSYTSVADRWGSAPTLIEPIHFNATVKVANSSGLEVWALDETGAKHHPVNFQAINANSISFVVDTSVDKTLWYAILLSGSTTGSIQGSVSNDSGAALNQVRVLAYRLVNNRWKQVATTTSNTSGQYQLSNLPPAAYRLRFSLSPYRTEYYDNVSALSAAKDVVVTAGNNTAAITAVLSRNRTTSPSSLAEGQTGFQLQVVDAQTGEAVEDAIITLYQLPTLQAPTCTITAGTTVEDLEKSWIDEQSSSGSLAWQVEKGCWYVEVESGEEEGVVASSLIAVDTQPVEVRLTVADQQVVFLPTARR